MTGTRQLSFVDATSPTTAGTHYKQNRLEKKLGQIRELHEELNRILAKPEERPSIHSPRDAYDYLFPLMSNAPREEFWIVLLDTRNKIKQLVKLYSGTVNQSNVRLAEVFRHAIIETAPAIIIAHNHPSGDPNPSPDDIAITRSIVEAGKLLDIDVLDHLIIGANCFASLKERGLGF
ncbi:RadC family protein [Chloroflexota bacterium]